MVFDKKYKKKRNTKLISTATLVSFFRQNQKKWFDKTTIELEYWVLVIVKWRRQKSWRICFFLSCWHNFTRCCPLSKRKKEWLFNMLCSWHTRSQSGAESDGKKWMNIILSLCHLFGNIFFYFVLFKKQPNVNK